MALPSWRGLGTALVYLGLRRAGLKDETRTLAEKSAALLLKEWRSHGHIHENYHADTGMDCGMDRRAKWLRLETVASKESTLYSGKLSYFTRQLD